MSTSVLAFVALCAAVGVVRLIEMRISRRHQRALAAHGASRRPERLFPAMVALHTAVIVGGPIEVLSFGRPWRPAVGWAALAVVLAAQGLRWWVIRTLGAQWNVQIVASTPSHGVVTSGPYRWIRHPNYVAVFAELAALPLVHGAWLTASLGALAHAAILAGRIRAEERVLMSDRAYRAAMGRKPRFVPELVPRSPRTSSGPRGGSEAAGGS
jgi:methyltransferase